jgi:hypothetical protein
MLVVSESYHRWLGIINHRVHRGRDEIGGAYLPLSAGAYTTALYIMVDIVKRDGRVPPTLTSLG